MQEHYGLLQQDLATYLNAENLALIHQAYEFAVAAHAEQVRVSGEPYITHPLAVARSLAQLRLDASTIVAALLHDVLEDTAVTPAELAAQFPEDVVAIVTGVTKLANIHFASQVRAQSENFRYLILAMNRDIRVILVKLADRLHNMRTLAALPLAKQRRIARETLEIFAPIAYRLGMHALTIELEDLSFAVLYPQRYRVLNQAVNLAHGNRQQMLFMLEQEIQERLHQANVGNYALIGRTKHLYGIYKKMHDKHMAFAEIMDVYGLRVVVDTIDNCYRVLGVLHNLYKPIHNRFKDYIAIPKSNAYQSLHTTLFGPYGVPLEVQIRTEAMHLLAEQGVAAHWLYKTQEAVDTRVSAAQSSIQAWLDSIVALEQQLKKPVDFINKLKIDLFPEKIYVFTPQGDILALPVGATVIDFAYAVHSDLGNTTVAAKVDKNLVPLSSTLTNGQQVEIITSADAKPNPRWLNFVVTAKAKSGIEYFTKKQKRTAAIALGEKLLAQALEQLGTKLTNISQEVVNAVLTLLQTNSTQQLFAAIGLGKRSARLVAEQLLAAAGHNQATVNDPVSLTIYGTEGLVVSYAHCCYPIPGDLIRGVMQAGVGLEIHTSDCPNWSHDQQKHLVALTWLRNLAHYLPVAVQVQLRKQADSLAKLTTVVAKGDANIQQIISDEHDSCYFGVKLVLMVKNRQHLARILRAIYKLPAVIKVYRCKPLPLTKIYKSKIRRRSKN